MCFFIKSNINQAGVITDRILVLQLSAIQSYSQVSVTVEHVSVLQQRIWCYSIVCFCVTVECGLVLYWSVFQYYIQMYFLLQMSFSVIVECF